MPIRLMILTTGWLTGWWLFWVVPRLRSGGGPARRTGSTVDVAIVIPARNEGGSLPNLLSSLAVQTVRPRQIVVVDDRSTDDTAAIAASHPGVTVLAGEPLPGGWTGKAWACHQGVSVTRAELVVFLDADVSLATDGVGAIVSEHERRGGLVSVQPFHKMERVYERCSAMFNLIGLMGVGAATPGRDGRSRGAFGPVLACSRDDYERVGGHAAVRSEVVEDIALAHRFAAHDLPVTTLGGGEVAAFRMYPDGLGQLVEGWSKNFATGAGSIGAVRLALIALWVTAVLMSVQSIIELPFTSASGLGTALAVALTGYAVVALQIRLMLRQVGNYGLWSALLYPALAVVFVIVFARSIWLTVVRREVRWRGRSIPISSKRRATLPGDASEGLSARTRPPGATP